MSFIDPMKAASKKKDVSDDIWFSEEKFDGHRLIVSTLGGEILAWSRDGKSRALPLQLMMGLSMLPHGIWDGELIVPGGKSHNVVELTKSGKLLYMVFDVLYLGNWTMDLSYTERRDVLINVPILRSSQDKAPEHSYVKLAESIHVANEEQLTIRAEEVWSRGGEGLIVKKGSSIYQPGKRSPNWFKVKQLQSEMMEVVGYREGRLGWCSILELRDKDGHLTTVKVKNFEELGSLENGGAETVVGKKLWVEFQERTEYGAPRHPRWDRWATEEEIAG